MRERIRKVYGHPVPRYHDTDTTAHDALDPDVQPSELAA